MVDYQKEKMNRFGSYDVVVIGGGTAGSAAAAAAARGGARTLVIEKDGFPGGMATGGHVGQFLGFVDGEEEPAGIMGEILQALSRLDATTGLYTVKLAGVYPTQTAGYDAEVLKFVLDGMLIESGTHILLHTKATDLVTEGDVITGIVIHNAQGYGLVEGKVFIDATFHGEIAAWAGCRWEKGRPGDGAVQPGTLVFRMANVDYAKFEQLGNEAKREIARRGIAEGTLYMETLISRPIRPPRAAENTVVFLNQSKVPLDPLDPKDLTRAEIEGRRQVQNIAGFYKRNVPGFENAVLVSTGAYLGQRDSRRIMGKYVLAREDIMAGTKFPDAVAATSYPIDIHEGTGVTFIRPERGVYYIPYRCMVNGTVKNLIVTGRCISTTDEAHAAVRIMAPCIHLGEAAGEAAAASVEERAHPADFDGAAISAKLLG